MQIAYMDVDGSGFGSDNCPFLLDEFDSIHDVMKKMSELIAHGYASMFANNEMEYDEQTVLSDLSLIFDGAVKALRGGF